MLVVYFDNKYHNVKFRTFKKYKNCSCSKRIMLTISLVFFYIVLNYVRRNYWKNKKKVLTKYILLSNYNQDKPIIPTRRNVHTQKTDSFSASLRI